MSKLSSFDKLIGDSTDYSARKFLSISFFEGILNIEEWKAMKALFIWDRKKSQVLFIPAVDKEPPTSTNVFAMKSNYF